MHSIATKQEEADEEEDEEEADAEPVWKYESRTWEYNIGATFHVDEEVRL